MNLFALNDISHFLSKYNVINLFGRLFEQLSSAVILYAALILLSVFTVIRLFVKNNVSISFKRIGLKFKLPRISVCPKSLLGYEFRKAAGNWLVIISLMLLVIVKIMLSSSEYQVNRSFNDAVYKNYMIQLEGEWTQEKSDFIKAQRQYFNEILDINKKEEMGRMYKDGEIEHGEYYKYIDEYYDAKAKSEPFERIEARNEYLISALAEGKDVAFVYDTSYNKLLFASMDITLLLLISILLSGIFADEYLSGFDKILRASPRGRRQVCRAKLIYAFIVTTAVFIAFSVIDAVNLVQNYDFASSSLPIASIPAFGEFGGLSLGAFIALIYIEKYIAYLIFVTFLCGLSLLLKRTVTALFVAAGTYFLPYILKSIVSDKFDYIDMTNLLSPGGYLVKSVDVHFINIFGLFASLLVLALTVALTTGLISVRRFCKTY
ncbi:MAG: hypothetical protein EOM87_08990 [Clostridia bacterium]|nr:hypothetical protein [Clostridia bacterium]